MSDKIEEIQDENFYEEEEAEISEEEDEVLEDEGDYLEDEVDEEEDEQEEIPAKKSFYGRWNRDTVGIRRFKVLLYGVAGTGKTTMAATFPSPLFLDLEGGLMSTLQVGEVFRYPANPDKDITTYSEVVEFYRMVKEAKNPEFKTIVIDSLNELQRLVARNVVARFKKVTRQYDDLLTIADYQKANSDMAMVIRLFLKLPYHIVFTAGATKREPGDDETQVGPKFIGNQVGPDVQRMMDLIGYCHSKQLKDGKSEHYVSFRITPQHIAKDRLGIVRRDIPNSFSALIGSTTGEK